MKLLLKDFWWSDVFIRTSCLSVWTVHDDRDPIVNL